jgi:adenosylhomocysteinase
MNIPIFMVCKSSIKLLLDCFYGCGVGFSKNWEETTDSPLSGREVTVVGAGEVGKGILVQAKAQGARVWSSEINPKRQLEAITTCGSHGILLRKAIRKNGMIIVLATGSNKYTLGKPALSNEILAKIPKGVGIWIVIMGSGQEVDLYGLCSLSTQIFSEASGSEISTDDVLKSRLNGVTRFELTSGGTVYLVGSGCGALNNDHGGHTTSTMDPVLAYWLMVPIYALQEKEKIKSGVQMVPEEVEQSLSLLVLNVLSVPCERRTLRQAKHYGIYFWDWFEEMKRKHER